MDDPNPSPLPLEPQKPLSRRQFLKRSAVALAGLSLAGCARAAGLTVTPSLVPTGTPTALPTGTPTARPSATAAPSPTPTRVLSPREQWLAAHEVERLRRVKSYGAARTITALEYHGNSYTLNGGTIDMNPREFARQMRRLKELDAHSVTFDELHGFLNGSLELPVGSIILTTDSGQKSYKSMPEMLDILAETGQHFQSFIWTKSMSPLECLLGNLPHCARQRPGQPGHAQRITRRFRHPERP